MGLDSFWKHPVEGTPHPTFDPPLRLCGGMFSGHGVASFRGKVYTDLIDRVTGHSLYQEEIDNDGVRRIADGLVKLQEEDIIGGIGQLTHYDMSADEIRDLKRMFRAYADAGFTLLGWW